MKLKMLVKETMIKNIETITSNTGNKEKAKRSLNM
jgi:hypothetical protein